MIKVEHKSLSDQGVDALAFECMKDEDLKVLDLLLELFQTIPNVRAGFIGNGKRLLVQVKVDATIEQIEAEKQARRAKLLSSPPDSGSVHLGGEFKPGRP